MKIILILFSSIVALFALEKNDFAFGKEIEIQENSGLIKIKLEPEVYEKLAHRNLSDLAVFDANGKIMPKDIFGPGADMLPSPLQEASFVKFDVLKSNKQEQLRFEYKGAVIDMNSHKKSKSEDYIIDLRKLTSPAQKLVIHTDLKKFMRSVSLECSQDLQQWTSLKSKAVLASLDFQDSLLDYNSIDLPYKRCEYLRLQTQDFLPITKVEVKPYSKETSPSLEVENLYMIKEDNVPFAFISQNIKVQSIRFYLNGKEQLYKIKILAKNKYDPEYKVIKEDDIYSVSAEGSRLIKNEIQLNSNYDFYKLEAQESSYLPEYLNLSYTYKRQDLYFLAQGKAPYTLAFGGKDISLATTNLQDLISNTKNIPQGKLLGKYDLGGEKKLYVRKKTKSTNYLVLFSLFFGVMLLAFISYRLFKQLQEENEQRTL